MSGPADVRAGPGPDAGYDPRTMPPRPQLPIDDLYARLEIPIDASFEAIEIAWRALLRRHHPDVAGVDGLERAKRINVAHDWLSDPAFRERYDRERHPRRRPSRWSAPGRPSEEVVRARSDAAPARTPRPLDPQAALDRFIDRAGRLSRDELDRFSVADVQSIAFVASIRRFLAAERVAAVDAAEARLRGVLPEAVWADPAIRDGILAAAHEIVLGDFLDEHLVEPFRERVRERLARAWDSAIDQPRYGPNSAAVARAVERASRLSPDEVRRLLGASGTAGLGEDPWPRGIDPAEDEGLRVSSALAARDVSAAAGPAIGTLDAVGAARARRLLGRIGHALALRHAFTAAEFDTLLASWRTATGDPGTGRASEASTAGPEVHRRT